MMREYRVYCEPKDRSEQGMLLPVRARLARLPGIVLSRTHFESDVAILPGDRYETARRAIKCFRDGIRIVHLGSDVTVDPVALTAHYDHFYRDMIERMAAVTLPIEHDIGPTQIDDLPNTDERPVLDPYRFVAINPTPWTREELPDVPDDLPVHAAFPGNDPRWGQIFDDMNARGWRVQLADMPRQRYLCFLRHAVDVWGNSSALCYEAPLWHRDEDIHLHGHRNEGRRIVRWDVEKDGHPADNACRRIAEWLASGAPDRWRSVRV